MTQRTCPLFRSRLGLQCTKGDFSRALGAKANVVDYAARGVAHVGLRAGGPGGTKLFDRDGQQEIASALSDHPEFGKAAVDLAADIEHDRQSDAIVLVVLQTRAAAWIEAEERAKGLIVQALDPYVESGFLTDDHVTMLTASAGERETVSKDEYLVARREIDRRSPVEATRNYRPRGDE